MITSKFTLLELTHLALVVPEVGAINFNILHTVLTRIILEMGLDSFKPPCYIENETLAQAAITKSRLDRSHMRRLSKVPTVMELRDRIKNLEDIDIEKDSECEPEKEDSSTEESKIPVEKTESSSSVEKAKEEEENVGKDTITEEDVETRKDISISDEEKPEKEDISTEDSEVADKKTETSSVEKASEKVEKKEEVEKETMIVEDVETLGVISTMDEEEIEKIVENLAEMTAETPEGDELEQDIEDSRVSSDMTIEEMRETAQDLMEQSADIMAKKVAIVTGGLKILQDEELLDAEPAKVMEELWRATNVNRRMDGAEEGLRQLSAIIDDLLDKVQDLEDASDDALKKTLAMLAEITKFLRRIEILEETTKTLNSRIDDSNEIRAFEVERLEGIIDELTKLLQDTRAALQDMEEAQQDLSARVAYKEDLEVLKLQISEELDQKVKDIMRLIREVEDTLVKKEDYAELVTRVEDLEESRVTREELGRLLEPGFIDKFLSDQENIRTELDELKITVAELQDELRALITRIEEEIIRTMEKNFADIYDQLEKINEKLALLDPDEINDAFANLEEQIEMIIKELEELKASYEQFQKEARINFNKISDFMELLNKLNLTKADKTKMYELLEMKADIDMLLSKLDRREFVEVVGEMKEDLKRLTITVKINEEQMILGFTNMRHELSLKMYTEDFITATEPIRNRIKALMYELKRVKQIALTHLFPDAPGVTKCISCKRGANLAGAKYIGDARVDMLHEVTPVSNRDRRDIVHSHVDEEKSRWTRSNIEKAARTCNPFSTVTFQESSDDRSQPISDLDSIPIPPADHPRQKEAGRLPLLFAMAKPQVGLVHEVRRRDIDKKLAAYFASRPIRAIDGEYTLTAPQQRGLEFTTITLPQVEKDEVLISGIDKGIYRCSMQGRHTEDPFVESQEATAVDKTEDEQTKKISDIPSLRPPRVKKGFVKPDLRPRSKQHDDADTVTPSVVSLYVDDKPVQKMPQFKRRA